MGSKITVLRTQRHGEFLAAQRQDPVTRKLFAAGDRVTLCAACLLPFLEESWGGVGGAHCGQSATVGLETFETAATPPDDRGGVDSGSSGTDVGADGRSDAAASDRALGLRPVPCKLHEVPIRLRG